MIAFEEWNWVVNTHDMTCRNLENQVTIKMEGKAENLKPMLHYMPIELFAEISGYSDGEKIIEGIVKMAGEEFLSSKHRV